MVRRRVGAVTALAVLAVSSASAGGALAAGPGPSDCFAELMRGTGEEIVCQFPLQPNAIERADLERQSRGYLKNARCLVSIRLQRQAILAAVHTPDYEFEAPAQPVRCDVTIHWREKQAPEAMVIGAAFAPKVSIRGGKAVDATPGLKDVTGVPRALSWPVEAFVNSGVGMKANMMQVINAWLDHMRHVQPAGRVPGRQAAR